ncbi:MAG: 16S rRNA (cytidine(1402)-2'-O)-methyltransferase [Bacteroidota bacterium]
MLHLVPTPIGNLEDMTFRSVRILREVDKIFAEDTRVTKRLLEKYDIDTPLASYHAFNEHKIVQGITAELSQGANYALVTDAGTPGISDPGFLLVRECVQLGIKVECLPGATAFVPALAVSGLPSDKFFFEGFLPHKKGRQTRLKYLAELPCTFILYESPHRLVKCLEQLKEHCGAERKACVARELTKLHEEIKTASVGELIKHFNAKKIKGEIVIVVSGK